MAAAIAALALLVSSSAATAAVTATGYKITSDLPGYPAVPSNGPSTLQAGANSDAGSYTSFSYTSGTEDLKTALTNFAAGLLGNPEATPKCSEAALQAGGASCPAGSSIGTSRLDTQIAFLGAPAGGSPGVVYNAEPLGNEPGRLGVVTPTAFGTLVSSIPFEITPRGASDYGLTGTLTDISRLPSPPFPFDLQTAALSFVLNGSTNKFVRNPTSCMQQTSTGQAIGYDDSTVAESPPYSFVTVACDQVPFRPALAIEMGDKGTTKERGYPPIVFKITQQQPGDSDQRGNKITLPIELNTNNTAYKICTQAQASADSCPANTKFGGAVAASPFLAEGLKGPVYLVEQSGSSLPGLLLDLQGRAHVKIQTKTTLINGRQIQSLALDAPQLPISELRVALNGGKSTGVFQNRQDLCFRGSSTTKVNTVNGLVKFYGWNGQNTGDTKVKASVKGCGPAVADSISGATGSRASVKVGVDKHPDAPNFKELRLRFSRNLSLVRSKIDSGASAAQNEKVEYVDSRTVKVTGLPATGVDDLTVRLRAGAVKISKHSRDLLNRGRSRRFTVKVTQTPVSGPATSTTSTFTAKASKR